MGHLDSQRSLSVLRDDKTGFSPMAKKLRLATGHTVAVLNSAAPWWVRRDVLGEITSVTGYKPVAFVATDDNYTAPRFKRV
jgi:hypothetical protein